MGEQAEAPMIVWDVSSARVENFQPAGLRPTPFGRLVLRLVAWHTSLNSPSLNRPQCDGPMGTTRRVATEAHDATAVLDRIGFVDWDSQVGAGRLQLEPFRAVPREPGSPWVAHAVLRGRRTRRLDVSIAIFTYGRARCWIEIRPLYRRPWSRRRLRRCLSSTHCAADRLRDIVLATDFQPIAA